MEILPPSDYVRVRDLFNSARLRLTIEALIAGNCSGTLWTDDRAALRSAFFWDDSDAMYLLGEAGNAAFNGAIAQLCAERILPHVRTLKIRYASSAWEGEMAAFFPESALHKGARVLYAGSRLALPDWRERIPAGFAMRAVDGALLADEALANIGTLGAEVAAHWPSLERFLAQGFGYAALCGTEIAGWCTGGLVSPGKTAVTIETVQEYRRRGLGTLMACAFLDRCQREGLTAYWDAWADNIPSVATAEHIGLTHVDKYTIYVYRR
jgi:GNAT superfamily N-acetyltransferase